ncbi:transmembrane protein, putative (macronuclear) [Tetrahymena thermophila SB210]|uniref:Transmembrane protein, putative n=1 Tax=Tetrahymena thermophila (strain SB210) TaxID=312017 RepID=Q23DZ9_TETTS|nr:transmembrane protein, putative [Tetrahymena thermophila SB210]EAR94788.1 transmembrane protein, putative [Tetrahymena thermophila SB210]|eukprot:XP_001015033.1 transmembrane protein, putative [Tetrahymena thermophila SB210]
MFLLNFIIAVIGYCVLEEKPSEKQSIICCIGKFFAYQYSVFKRGFESCVNRFAADILCLLVHCAIICGLNAAFKDLFIVFQFIFLEVAFYFSEFTMRIFPYSINFKKDLLKTLCVYIFEVFMCMTPLFTGSIKVSIGITLAIHFILLISLITRNQINRKHHVLFSQAEQCLQVNLKEDINASINSNCENSVQHYVIKYANKIQLVSLSHPKASPQISPQESINNKNNNQIISKNNNQDDNNTKEVCCNQEINNKKNNQYQQNSKNLILNEILPVVSINVKSQSSEDKQLMNETREKQLTVTKSSLQPPKFKSEDEPTTRKQLHLTESPQLQYTYGNNGQIANSNHLILNGNTNTSIYQNHNIQNNYNSNNNNMNMKSISQTMIQSNHQTTVNLKCQDKFEQKKNQQQNSKNEKSSIRTRSLSFETENINIDIINTIELDADKDSNFEIISFHEQSQNLLIKTETAVFFFSLPDFKKTKSILLDKNSKYIFHQTEPYCIQYHYNPTNYQFQFTQLNLSQPKITKEDMKYNSLTMQNPKYESNDILFYSSFVSDSSTPKDILFIADGPDLITVNTESLSMENYTAKLPLDDSDKIQIQQLNKRQVVINTPHQTQLTKIVLDIPTNICCRKFTNLPMSTDMLAIENLQNQIILNNQKMSKNSCVFDINTGECMELPSSKCVNKAWFVNKMLYIIDQSKQIKIYSFSGTNFNLLPPSDNGIGCISIAFF